MSIPLLSSGFLPGVNREIPDLDLLEISGLSEALMVR